MRFLAQGDAIGHHVVVGGDTLGNPQRLSEFLLGAVDDHDQRELGRAHVDPLGTRVLDDSAEHGFQDPLGDLDECFTALIGVHVKARSLSAPAREFDFDKTLGQDAAVQDFERTIGRLAIAGWSSGQLAIGQHQHHLVPDADVDASDDGSALLIQDQYSLAFACRHGPGGDVQPEQVRRDRWRLGGRRRRIGGQRSTNGAEGCQQTGERKGDAEDQRNGSPGGG
jgi:hypothetical protein